jgi:hypothetical protein
MAITKVQNKVIQSLMSFGDNTVTLDSSVTAGNLIIVSLPSTEQTPVVSDSQGNTYTQIAANKLYYTVATSSGSLTVTVFLLGVSFYTGDVAEFSGVNTLDVTTDSGAYRVYTAPGTLTLTTGTPSQADYLAIGHGTTSVVYGALPFPNYETLSAPFSLLSRSGDLMAHFHYVYSIGSDGVADNFSLAYTQLPWDWGNVHLITTVFKYVAPPSPCTKIRGKCKIRGKVFIR